MYANLGDKHANKHKTHQILFSYLQNKTYMHKQSFFTKHAYKPKSFSPFLSIINKGVKVKTKQCSPSLCQQIGESNQPIKRYMRYTFMKRKTLS